MSDPNPYVVAFHRAQSTGATLAHAEDLRRARDVDPQLARVMGFWDIRDHLLTKIVDHAVSTVQSASAVVTEPVSSVAKNVLHTTTVQAGKTADNAKNVAKELINATHVTDPLHPVISPVGAVKASGAALSRAGDHVLKIVKGKR